MAAGDLMRQYLKIIKNKPAAAKFICVKIKIFTKIANISLIFNIFWDIKRRTPLF